MFRLKDLRNEQKGWLQRMRKIWVLKQQKQQFKIPGQKSCVRLSPKTIRSQCLGKWMNDTWNNDIRMNDTRINDTWMNDTRMNDTWMNDTRMNDTAMNDTWMNDTRMNDIRMNDTWMNDTWNNYAWMKDTRMNDTALNGKCKTNQQTGAQWTLKIQFTRT